MGEDIKLLLEVVEKVSTMFGPILGAIILLTIIALFLILVFFNSRLAGIASEISEKAISQFNKRLDLIFRDEEVRRSLRSDIGKRSVEVKLDLYSEMYQLYFDYQKSWQYSPSTFRQDAEPLWEKIVTMRQKVFLNSHFLGGYLSEYFIQILITMMDTLTNKSSRHPFNSHGYKIDLQNSKNETAISDFLEKSRKWIQENLITDQNVKDYELTPDQAALLDEEKKQFIAQPQSKA